MFNLGVVNWNLVAGVSNFAGGMDFLPKILSSGWIFLNEKL